MRIYLLVNTLSELTRGNLMSSSFRFRILIAKPGLDGHDRGAKIIARALRDAGMEVIYTGIRQTPEQIVQAALQEDVQAIGLSILSGAHMQLFPRIMELLKKEGLDNQLLIFAGGIIPNEDVQELIEIGISKVFGPGTSTSVIVEYLTKALEDKFQP